MQKNTAPIIKRTIFDSVNAAIILGAGLVALMNPNESQLLDLNQNSQIFLLLLGVGGIASYYLNQKEIKTLGELLFEPPYKKVRAEVQNWWRTFWGIQLIGSFVAAVAIGVVETKFSLYELTDASGFKSADQR